MALSTPEIATRYGALDSDAFADGAAVSSHLLRVMAMNANRLVCVGEPILSLIWDAGTDDPDLGGDDTDGGLLGWAPPFWTQIIPGPITVPKKPGQRSLECLVTARIGGSEVVDFMVVTTAEGARYRDDAQAADANVFPLTGDGTSNWLDFSGTGIPCGEGPWESLSFFVRGRPTSTNLVTATYGSPASGTVDALSREGVMTESGASWNTSPAASTMSLKHYVQFEDASGNAIATPRLIIDVTSASTLQFWPPPLSSQEHLAMRSATFKIRELPAWRISHVAVNTEDRTR